MRYPADSEWEYIQDVIEDDFLFHRLHALMRAMEEEIESKRWRNGDRAVYTALQTQYEKAQLNIMQERWHREDNLYRLYLDTQLRAEGKTYADVVEDNQNHETFIARQGRDDCSF